jgi:hypothetical protein
LHAWRIAGWRRFLVAAAIAAIILAAGSLALAIRRLPRQRALQRQFNAKLFELSFHKMKPPNKGQQPSRTHSIRAARLQAKKKIDSAPTSAERDSYKVACFWLYSCFLG